MSVSALSTLKTRADIANLLGVPEKQLRFLLYGRLESDRYRSFTIPKKRGGLRTITAPMEDLKHVQRRLDEVLRSVVNVRPSTHGFIRTRSIITNAEKHIARKYVLNIDLKDFFPSIHFGRVQGLFMSPYFGASKHIATILAQICCHEGILPQGAPTSPTISNMICFRMDGALTRLCSSYGCTYTRYADDITISKRKGTFPTGLAFWDQAGYVQVGTELRKVIENNRFTVHPEKIRLQNNQERQSVTGIVVNQKLNVPREYIRNIRAVIHHWKVAGRRQAEKKHHKYYYRRKGILGNYPPIEYILAGKLEYLKMVRGVNDPVRRTLQRQLSEVWDEYFETMERENKGLAARDVFIAHASEDKEEFIRPLVEALIRQSVSVWYDEYEIAVGTDIVAAINDGLSNSKFGVVVLSPSFLDVKKRWSKREVGALTMKEDVTGESAILPIWHNVDDKAIEKAMPLLLSIRALVSPAMSPNEIALELAKVVRK